VTCPGCISSAVGHDQDCPVMSEAVARQFPLHGALCPERTVPRMPAYAPMLPTANTATKPTPADRIRERIVEKRAEYENFKDYLAMRVREEDLHGIWDCGAQMSEVSCFIEGLQFALDVLEGHL
jgi:hypothetical protein